MGGQTNDNLLLWLVPFLKSHSMIAISIRVVEQVHLVLLLRLGEVLKLAQLRFDLRVNEFVVDGTSINGPLQLRFDPFGDLQLLVVTAKDPARVLKAAVVPLPILQCWVVEREEESAKLLEMFAGVVQLYVQYFDVTG